MAKRHPAGSGPGRGTPRSRATARPGAGGRHARATGPVRREEVPEGIADEPTPRRLPAAGAITWRLVVLVVVILGVGIVLAQSLRIYFMQAAQIAETRQQIADTKATIADQQDELARWEDPEFVRSQARVRLGWVMPGEVGYRVIGPDGKPLDGSESAEDAADISQGPWFERMWRSVEVADEPAPAPSGASSRDPDVVIGTEAPSPSPTHS